MGIVNLTNYERELCIEVVSKRRIDNQRYYQNETEKQIGFKSKIMSIDDTVYEALNAPMISITPTHKAYISGCLMEHVIDNSETILSSKDFEFLIEHDRKDWDAKFLRYDTAAQLRNKFSPNRLGSKHRLIYPIQELIEKVLDCYKVLYSITDHGKIYKVAICISETQSWNIEVESEHSFDAISISTYPADYRRNYMHSASPSVILDLINSFEKENELGSGQLKLKQLIEKILESKMELV